MVIDPVCKKEVDETKTGAWQGLINYEGKRYFFCGGYCRAKFEASPETYAIKDDGEDSIGADFA